MMRSKNKYLIIFILGVALVITGYLSYPKKQVSQELDAFAKCLADKGITMYGADWCSRCLNEKKAFGDSFRFVPYVECPDEPQRCIAQGIKGYPTWIFPDGARFEGEQGIKKLSEESGCRL